MRRVTYRRVEWATDFFALYISPGVAMLQKARGVIILHLVRIIRACLSAGYVPVTWRQAKPGRNSYCGPGDYKPISLT